MTLLTARPDVGSVRGGRISARGPLPRWPLAFMFVGFPAWWAIGLLDIMLLPTAAIMTAYLVRRRAVSAPVGFGLWLMFMVWVSFTGLLVNGGGAILEFTYRYGIYVSCTIMFLYVYNGAEHLTRRYVAGCMTALWIVTIVGGYLGGLFPNGQLRTPMSFVVPDGLMGNQLVNYMVIRRLAQYNPDSFLQVAPRPSAPFLYTNNWGSVYSLLLPFVVAYLLEVRGEWRFRAVAILLPISAVPAFLTLNRGMFLGIGISMVYVAVRLSLVKRAAPVIALVVAAALGLALFTVLPVEERLGNRLSTDADKNSNDTRLFLYVEALASVPKSPFLGHGGPFPSAEPRSAPVGTQGQFWMLLVSHGPFATALFLMFFLSCYFRSWRRMDPVGLAANTVLLVSSIELLYYGSLPYGLPIVMTAAALARREEES
ncbi:MAG: O-antigen ligase family protein [Nocardioides sp.]